MKELSAWAGMAILAVLFLGVLEFRDCRDQGGELVRGVWWFKCLAPDGGCK